MDIEQIAAAMPKTEPLQAETIYYKAVWQQCLNVQCLHLAKEGYRKVCFCDPLYSGEEHCSGFCAELKGMGYRQVPSAIEMATKLDEVLPLCKDYIDPIDSVAKAICRWLLERE